MICLSVPTHRDANAPGTHLQRSIINIVPALLTAGVTGSSGSPNRGQKLTVGGHSSVPLLCLGPGEGDGDKVTYCGTWPYGCSCAKAMRAAGMGKPIAGEAGAGLAPGPVPRAAGNTKPLFATWPALGAQPQNPNPSKGPFSPPLPPAMLMCQASSHEPWERWGWETVSLLVKRVFSDLVSRQEQIQTSRAGEPLPLRPAWNAPAPKPFFSNHFKLSFLLKPQQGTLCEANE